jgi:hypothetical protein
MTQSPVEQLSAPVIPRQTGARCTSVAALVFARVLRHRYRRYLPDRRTRGRRASHSADRAAISSRRQPPATSTACCRRCACCRRAKVRSPGRYIVTPDAIPPTKVVAYARAASKLAASLSRHRLPPRRRVVRYRTCTALACGPRAPVSSAKLTSAPVVSASNERPSTLLR